MADFAFVGNRLWGLLSAVRVPLPDLRRSEGSMVEAAGFACVGAIRGGGAVGAGILNPCLFFP